MTVNFDIPKTLLFNASKTKSNENTLSTNAEIFYSFQLFLIYYNQHSKEISIHFCLIMALTNGSLKYFGVDVLM